ncbi:MAG: hypothetical protein A2806_01775 [Candidatus Terrybacteria bacterium RIFCSPHIGHO2_01_FULL_48_17]|uniref:Uncharacterized protein n=1 Tax=Candidatus Terrybacteria bacterium RIFCSPHIGHO2_01_FULL_48_17 TaxID=1802362 RepID=A0A1G2PN49_9BACT|nr:MAG: hypothetical protein A2806_01775 [Candidatus Terrybacteria bacterium RIFCSPHIGHO2_01_FULL_48_17]OHA52662.1 MAG: hypothetical protein A3A30_03520 [Candidatus Terrybacteria bacterium RIFCSPLOWO2_01_FULL_48_14]
MYAEDKTSRALERADVILFPPQTEARGFVIEGPGEYDCAGFRIKAVPVFKKAGEWENALVVSDDESSVCLLSPTVARSLKDEHIDAIGTVDIMIYVMAHKGSKGNKEGEAVLKGIEAVHQIEPSVFIPVGAPEVVAAAVKFIGAKNPEEQTSFRYKIAANDREQDRMRTVIFKK